ncbi:MAG TPA: hybrid sensor histidine kinase/response regulator, partial [Chryseobacterium sp.]|nr:hybrid sensor histidine kinase/response regulator [Chryseobacterium sp.]
EVLQQTHPEVKLLHQGQVGAVAFGDEMRLEQVIINFITNAIKYAPDSTEVHITTELRNDEVYFSVRDFGIGMDRKHQSKIFDKFYRVEETSERFQGLGIGLYICREIIERHQGTIGVHSTPGEGSEFYFSIPLQPEAVAKPMINHES